MNARNGRKASRRILIAACAAVLGTPLFASAANITWSGANANNSLWSTATNWEGNTAPVAHDALIFSGVARLTPNNDFAAATAFDGITFDVGAGAFNLVGNQITLSGDLSDNTTLLNQTITLGLLLDGNRNVGVVDTGSLTIAGIVSGGFGITKTGGGTLLLTGANTFSGTLGITGGIVSVSSDGNLGATTAGANRLLIDGGALRSTANMTIASTRGIALGNAAGGGGTFIVNSGTTLTYGGVISNNGGSDSLTKLQFGTLALSGANTYTGATNVRNGTLQLNFNDAAAPATNIISPGSNLVLGGATAGLGQNNNATLLMTGKNAASSIQTFNNTNIDIYGSVITVNNGTTGGTATLNLGALTHTVGGTVVIPTNSTNGTVRTTTGVATTNGILGGWAVAGTTDVQRGITQGSAFATVDGTGKIVPYTAHVAVPIYTPGDNSTLIHSNPTILANADKNVRFTGSATSSIMRVDLENAGTTTDINTFSYLPNGANHTLIIGTGNTLRLGKYGGIFKPVNGNNQVYIGGTLDQPLSGNGVYGAASAATPSQVGFLTAGGPTLGSPGEIVLTTNETANNNGTLNILSSIVDNGVGGTVTLIKTSVSSVKIDGHNTYSGGTFINQGRFQLAGSEVERKVNPDNPTGAELTYGNPDGLGSGPVVVAPGGYLFVSGVNGTGLFTGPGAIPGAIANTAQNAPIPNAMTISGVGTSQEGIGAIRLGGKAILSGQITLGGDARISGSSNNGNPNAAYDTYPAINADGVTLYVDPSHELAGKITGNFNLDLGSNASITSNFKISNPANDWSGDTTFVTGGGTAIIRLGNNEVIPNGPGKGNLVWGPLVSTNIGRLDLQGHNETVNGLSTTTANLGSVIIENTGFGATVVAAPTPERPDLKGYAFSAGTSTLTVGDFDATATFGGTIRDTEGTRQVTLPNPNYNPVAGVDPEGDTATLTFTAPWVDVGGGVGAKVALTKIGGGVQTLTGQNEYTGDTNINNGALVVIGQLAQAGKVKINSSASSAGTLSGTGSVGDVTMAASVSGHKATIAPGGTAAVGNIGTITLNSLTVNGGDLAIDVGQGNSDIISVPNQVTFSGPSTISPGPSGAAGTYGIVQSNLPIIYNSTPTLVMPTLTRSTFELDTTSSANIVYLVVKGGSKSITWTGNSNGKWDIVGFQNWTDGNQAERFFNGDAVTFGDVNTNRNLTLDVTVLPSSITFTNSSASNYTLSGVGGIGGSGGFFKAGDGQVTIATNNSWAGPTQISQGTVQVGNGGTTGSLGSGAISNNGVLIFNRSDNFTVAQAIDGEGSLIKQGAGALRLSGISSYAGNTAVQQGTIIVTNSNSLGGIPSGAVNVSSGAAVDLSGDATANDLNFQGKAFNIAGTGVNGTGALTNSGTVAQQNALQTVNLTADATVGGTGRFDLRVNGGGTANLDLAGHTLTKTGTNQVTLVSTDVTDGNIVVNQGTLAIEAATNIPVGTGTITYNDGTTMQFWGNTGNVLRPVVINGAVTTGNANNNLGATIAANMTVNGSLTAAPLNNANTTSLTLSGNIGGSGSLAKTGPTTTLTLSGANTYSGGTAVNAGTLIVNNTAGSATGTGNVTLAANTTLTGNGTIAGNVVAGGASHIVPTDFNSGLGTLTMGGLNLAEGAILDFEGMTNSFDRINLTGANTLSFSGNAVMNFVDVGGLIEGSYTLIDYNGAPIGNLSGKLTLANSSVGGFNASLIDDPINTAIKIKFENPNGVVQWTLDGNGSWGDTGNWTGGNVPSGVTSTARYLGAITGPRVVTLDGDRTVGAIAFDNANKYTIAAGSGGTLSLGDSSTAGSIIVTTGNHEISAPLAIAGASTVDVASGQSLALSGTLNIAAGNALTKVGQGTLRISGGQNHGAGASLVAEQGTVQLDSNQGTSNSAAGSHLAVSVIGNPSGTASSVVLNADEDLASLSVNTADAGTQTLDLHSPAAGGQFHAVRIYAADLTSAKNSLAAAIRNANTAGAADPLDGIIDSGLHSGSAIGIAITGDHVTIRPTRVGDLNLDGTVSISDFIDLASNFNTVNRTWQEGDLNNDGSVTISDFIDLASNFNASYAGGVGVPNPDDFQTLASFASSLGVDPSVIGSAVPEPATLSLLSIGALGLLKRRRRNA